MPDRNISDLWSRGKFWEIFGFSSGDFTTLELAKQYSALTKAHYGNPEVKQMIEEAFATLNTPLTRQFYENCRVVMQRIRSEVGDKRYGQAESSMWEELWKWVSQRWQEPPEELVNSLKVKHAKSKITDAAKRAAYEAWVAENEFDMSICWFCGKNISSGRNNLAVNMHKVLERMGNKVRYQPLDILIPRCAACASQHSLEKTLAYTGGVLTAGGAVLGFGLITGEWWMLLYLLIPLAWIAVGIAALPGYAVGWVIGKLLGIGKPMKAESHYKSSPIYRLALSQGYQGGKKPGNT